MQIVKHDTYIDQKEIVSRLNSLRGLFAILIVIGHCSMAFEEELLPFYIIHKFNMVGVCFFFYVSGVSLVYNFYHKDKYLAHFIRNKVLLLFVLAVVAKIIGDLIKTVTIGYVINFANFFWEFNWYIYEMLVFYIIFYFVYRFCKSTYWREGLLAVMTLIICLGTLYCYKYGSWTGWSRSYYISSFSFLWGIIIGEHYDRIYKILCKHMLIYNAIFFLIAIACCFSLSLPDDHLGGVILKNILGICIINVVTSCCCVVCPKEIPYISNILTLLTNCSTEIYLYQFCLLDAAEQLFRQNNLKIGMSYIVAVVASVCILAYFIHFLDIYIYKLIKISNF